jgi:hypothetical protein
MPQTFNNDPGLTDIERPPCPKCHGPSYRVQTVSTYASLNAPYVIAPRRSKHRDKCDVFHVSLGSGVGRVNADNFSALDANARLRDEAFGS